MKKILCIISAVLCIFLTAYGNDSSIGIIGGADGPTSIKIAEEEILTPAIAITLTAVSTVLVLIAIFYAAKVDYETGVYECRKCGHTFKPTFKAYIWGAHTLTTRHLKCPNCKEKSWCRKHTPKDI